LLNPSTATELADDPTLRKCRKFARAWGYGSLVIGNVYAYRSTDPKGLWLPGVEPVGADNDEALRDIVMMCDRIVVGWGNHAEADRQADIIKIIRNADCFAHNADGSPKHPLYVKDVALPYQYAVGGVLAERNVLARIEPPIAP
jgi:hypothetical protein